MSRICCWLARPIDRETSRSAWRSAPAAGASCVNCWLKACCWRRRAVCCGLALSLPRSPDAPESSRANPRHPRGCSSRWIVSFSRISPRSAWAARSCAAWSRRGMRSRTSLAATLNDAGRGSAGGRSRRRWMGAFVVAQVAAGARAADRRRADDAEPDQPAAHRRRHRDQRADADGLRSSTERRRRPSACALPRSARGAPGIESGSQRRAGQPCAARRAHASEDSASTGRPASEPEALPLVSLVGVGRRYFDVVGRQSIAGPSARRRTTCDSPAIASWSTSDSRGCISRMSRPSASASC